MSDSEATTIPDGYGELILRMTVVTVEVDGSRSEQVSNYRLLRCRTCWCLVDPQDEAAHRETHVDDVIACRARTLMPARGGVDGPRSGHHEFVATCTRLAGHDDEHEHYTIGGSVRWSEAAEQDA